MSAGTGKVVCKSCTHLHSFDRPCHVYIVDTRAVRKRRAKWQIFKPPASSNTANDGDEEATAATSGSQDSIGDDSSMGSLLNSDSENEEEDEDSEEGSVDEDEEDSSSDITEGEGENVLNTKKDMVKNVLSMGKKVMTKVGNMTDQAMKTAARMRGKRPPKHITEKWAADACMKRCNCEKGVHPPHNPEPRRWITSASTGFSVEARETADPSLLLDERKDTDTASTFPSGMPVRALEAVMSSLTPRQIANACKVCTVWHHEAIACGPTGEYRHPQYVHMSRLVCEGYLHEAHRGRVDAVSYYSPPRGHSGFLLTTGDRKVRAWSWNPAVDAAGQARDQRYDGGKWELVCEPIRDTSPMTHLIPANGNLYAASGNGAVREWALAHEPKSIDFRAQLWEHNSWINDMVFSVQSDGYCIEHGALSHFCRLFTCSDDRSIKVWDVQSRRCLATANPIIPRSGTVQALARSDFHLYASTSGGLIFVYCQEKLCQRLDRHLCMQTGPQWLCLQETLAHVETLAVTSLACCGPYNDRFRNLFSGAQDGSIKVWQVPVQSFGHKLLRTLKGHISTILSIRYTSKHLLSADEGGQVRIWCLQTLSLQRVFSMDGGRRIRSMSTWQPHSSMEIGKDESNQGKQNGKLILGLSNGDVALYRMGWAV
jgi:WD40 repeat protein